MKKQTPQENFSSLSPRQKEVLRLVCQGTEYKEIADLLIISISAVKSHMRAVYDKFDLLHLKRDERIFKIRMIYCPMFEENSEETSKTSGEVLDPETELEPEAVLPRHEERCLIFLKFQT